MFYAYMSSDFAGQIEARFQPMWNRQRCLIWASSRKGKVQCPIVSSLSSITMDMAHGLGTIHRFASPRLENGSTTMMQKFFPQPGKRWKPRKRIFCFIEKRTNVLYIANWGTLLLVNCILRIVVWANGFADYLSNLFFFFFNFFLAELH